MKYLYDASISSGWTAVASEQQLILVNSPSADTLEKLWTQRSEGVQAAVEILSAGGLSATPSFALVEWATSVTHPSRARVIVRGPVSVVVTNETAPVTLSGAGVSTWAEQIFDDVTVCDVAAESAGGEATLPLVAGIVVTQTVRCSLSFDGADKGIFVPPITPTPATAPEKMAESQPVISTPAPTPEPTPAPTPTSAPAAAPTPTPTPNPAPDTNSIADVDAGDGFDYMFGETVFVQVGDAAEKVEGDHDGLTIMTGDLGKLRRGRSQAAAGAGTPQPAAPVVLYLQMPSGAREMLIQPILIGRAPTVSKVSRGALPKLVTIPGDKDISRNHIHAIAEGGAVVVTDLHSRNGTLITLPGKAPQRLRAGEPTATIVGTLIDLGGGVTFTVGEEN